jgi:hypothetical protein
MDGSNETDDTTQNRYRNDSLKFRKQWWCTVVLYYYLLLFENLRILSVPLLINENSSSFVLCRIISQILKE